jgi:hypothetical protein
MRIIFLHARPALFFMSFLLGPGILLSFGRTAGTSSPHEASSKSVFVPLSTARPGDVSSIDGIVRALYQSISGPPGQPRQWSRDRTLYIEGVQFVAMNEDSAHHPTARVMTYQQFVDATDAKLVKSGFFESEIHRKAERFGNIANILSTYESRYSENGPVIDRGVNSIELFWNGHRWWIVTVIWDRERSDNPMPKELLP